MKNNFKKLNLTCEELETLKEAYKKGGSIIKVPRQPCKVALVLYVDSKKNYKILQTLTNELSSKLQEFYFEDNKEPYCMVGLKSFVEKYR